MKKTTLILVALAIVFFVFVSNSTAEEDRSDEVLLKLGVVTLNEDDYNEILVKLDNFFGHDRIWFEMYDYDKDGKVDWLRCTDYNPDYQFRANSIAFYKGDGYLTYMLKTYGSHLDSFADKKIPENETGTCDYTGGHNELFFKPITDIRINCLFDLADRLLKNKGQSYKNFSKELLDYFQNHRVADYPAEWRQFN